MLGGGLFVSILAGQNDKAGLLARQNGKAGHLSRRGPAAGQTAAGLRQDPPR